MGTREFTGTHALMIFGGAFSVIITVNLALAYNAVSTFPGVEVKNSYVASHSSTSNATHNCAWAGRSARMRARVR